VGGSPDLKQVFFTGECFGQIIQPARHALEQCVSQLCAILKTKTKLPLSFQVLLLT
jgi:hypothetical protein